MRLIPLGFSCNNSCVFCAQGSLRNAPTKHSIFSAAPGESLAFVGGEPTLREDLPALIAKVKRQGAAWVLLQTNGRRLLYSDYVQALKSAGLDACEVALQGSSAAMHDYHTGVPGSWLQTIAGLKQLRSSGLPTGVSVVVTRSNFRHLAEIAALARELGARAIRFNPAQPLGKALAARDRVVPSAELIAPFLAQARARAEKLGLRGDQSKLFAGIGETETAPQACATAPAAQAAKARPKPALREVRTSKKRSGEELKTLFPGLFEPRGGGA